MWMVRARNIALQIRRRIRRSRPESFTSPLPLAWRSLRASLKAASRLRRVAKDIRNVQRNLIEPLLINLTYIDLRGPIGVALDCLRRGYLRYWQDGDFAMIGDCDGKLQC